MGTVKKASYRNKTTEEETQNKSQNPKSGKRNLDIRACVVWTTLKIFILSFVTVFFFVSVKESSKINHILSLIYATISKCPPQKLRTAVFSFAILARVLLLIYGEWQDRNCTVKYTDVDYFVYTDAAKLILDGKSPYQRHTYRYTPIIAILNIPNVLLHIAAGKVLFCLCDIGCGLAIERILCASKCNATVTSVLNAIWLIHPLVIAVSTRGSADSFVALIVLWFMWCIITQRYKTAGILLGLAVHCKLYPIVYAFPALMAVNPMYLSASKKRKGFVSYLLQFVTDLNRSQIIFIIYSAVSFGMLMATFYFIYGWEFLFEAYLYHFIRHDHRHNFSLFFYYLYLTAEKKSVYLGFLTFLPQMVTTLGLGIFYARKHFVLGCFLQTLTFVSLNKVITSQYFIWWLPLLPTALGFLHLNASRTWSIIKSLILFQLAQLHWLFWAYRLEFLGLHVFPQLFVAAGILCIAQVSIGWRLMNMLR